MKQKIPVCQKAFLDTLRLTKNRVVGVVSRHFQSGDMPKERRGGSRILKQYELKKKNVINFIKKFKAHEMHYCRSKSSSRVYLSSNLNIKKMWRMYDKETDDESLKVKDSFFRRIFRTKFNIGFGSPRTDACSTCISLHERIRHEKQVDLKQNLIAQKRLHKLKAKAFYNLLKEKRDDLLIVSFDCQKNQVLPKVPDQSAYYSRQLYKYNLTIVVGDSNSSLTKDNVFIYHWDETQFGKGPNEIISAVHNFLSEYHIPDKIKVLRIISDGCGAQNKNYYMMGMISHWLMNTTANIESIEYVFPIVGHSFLPSDRVFALIEKVIKKNDVIIKPDDYTEIFAEFGRVIPLAGINYDWKKVMTEIVRPPGQWKIKFNPCKRFFFKINRGKDNVLIKGEVNYKVQLQQYCNVCKKNKKISDCSMPSLIQPAIKIAPLKLRDVTALLAKHYGDGWEDIEALEFYKKCVMNNNEALASDDQCENEIDDDLLHI